MLLFLVGTTAWAGKIAEPFQANQDWNKFIINGQNAEANQFPFHVGLIRHMESGNTLCSGSLISRRSILTSASCLTGAERVSVFLGAQDMTSNTERYQARLRVNPPNYIIHPDYVREGRTLMNDVALIRMPHTIAFFTPAVNVVSLPSAADRDGAFSATQTITMG